MIIMAEKKTGISRELIIHPGETIADILDDRHITQAELAAGCGVSPAYVSNVVSGKKGISVKFACALEYALDVPKSFWLNLQAHYDAELMEIDETATITTEERDVRKVLKDIIKYLTECGEIRAESNRDETILSLRRLLRVSSLTNLKDIVPSGEFRMNKDMKINPYVLGAWLRICQISGEDRQVDKTFSKYDMNQLTAELKDIMTAKNINIQKSLQDVMKKYGIVFSAMRNFRGAPVQGYISQKEPGVFHMVLTLRGAFADIFWFSLFHEIGHIVNGDVGKTTSFIDYDNSAGRETLADAFARDTLLDPEAYSEFIKKREYDNIKSIKSFAESQHVAPFIVIGRLQKEKFINYASHSQYKTRYKWASS